MGQTQWLSGAAFLLSHALDLRSLRARARSSITTTTIDGKTSARLLQKGPSSKRKTLKKKQIGIAIVFTQILWTIRFCLTLSISRSARIEPPPGHSTGHTGCPKRCCASNTGTARSPRIRWYDFKEKKNNKNITKTNYTFSRSCHTKWKVRKIGFCTSCSAQEQFRALCVFRAFRSVFVCGCLIVPLLRQSNWTGV